MWHPTLPCCHKWINHGQDCRGESDDSCRFGGNKNARVPLAVVASLLFTSTSLATGSHFQQGSRARMRDGGIVIVSAAGLGARNGQVGILFPCSWFNGACEGQVVLPWSGPKPCSNSVPSFCDGRCGTISLRWSSWGMHQRKALPYRFLFRPCWP